MYCGNRNCYNEVYTHPDNWEGLCEKHFREKQELMKKFNDPAYIEKCKKESLKKIKQEEKAKKK